MTQLFEHQKEGIKFLKKVKKGILADSMGIGKTRQAIVAAGEESEKPTLIICPASLKINWEREIHMVYPEDVVAIIGGKNDEIPDDSAWYVINYDNIGTHFEKLNELDWETLILDEAHYIKNTTAIRSKNSIKLCKKAKRAYLLTGTMILNRPMELFNLLKAVDHPLGEDWYRYGRAYCNGFLQTLKSGQRFWNFQGASNLQQLRKNIQDIFLRREKKDVLDLPEKIISNIPIEMDDTWRKKYDKAWDDYLIFLEQNPLPRAKIDNIMMARHLIEIQKLKQICSLSKVKSVIREVENMIDHEEKVVIFTQYKQTFQDLFDGLNKHGLAGIEGSTKSEQRQYEVDKFQNDEGVSVFLGNIKAAGIGINLTAGTKVIFSDLMWTPADHEQAMDRCDRIGQNNMVNVYYFIAKDTLEEQILELLDRKSQIIAEVIEGTANKVNDFSVAANFIKGIKK